VWEIVGGTQGAKIFNVGDEIAGSKIVRIRPGSNGKQIVIGRNMDKRVIPVAKDISAEYWTGFKDALSNAENLANNKAWINSKISEGYTVIDIGLDPYYVSIGDLSPGQFYEMELFEVFGIK
jgi:hypothetical protein